MLVKKKLVGAFVNIDVYCICIDAKMNNTTDHRHGDGDTTHFSRSGCYSVFL